MNLPLDRRRIGAALAGIGILTLVVLFILLPPPEHPDTFVRRELDPTSLVWEGDLPATSHPARGVRFLVAAPSATHYDAERHVTWALFGYCSHQPCGVALRFDGDARSKLNETPVILVPVGDAALELEWLEPGIFEHPYGKPVGTATMTVPFDARPLGAEPWLYAAAGAAVLVGAALAIPQRRFAIALAAASAGGVALGATAASVHFYMVLSGAFLLVLVAVVGFGGLLVATIRRRPPPAWGIGCLSVLVVYLVSALLLLHYNVRGGGEI